MTEEHMDSLLWQDFWQLAYDTKLHELCCSAYANRMRRRSRWYGWGVIVVPGIFALLTPLWDYFPLIGCGLTSIGGILAKTQPLATQSESDLDKLNSFQKEFSQICVKLEKLFHLYRLDDSIGNLEVNNSLNDLKVKITKIKPEMDKLVRRVPNNKKLNKRATEYANSKFVMQ